MSRYDFPGIAPYVRVSIGWDRPSQTFFVQVTQAMPPADAMDDDDPDEDDRTILWLGTAPGEIPYAADAIRIARSYAVLPPDIGGTLETDRLRTAADSDGPAQQAARTFLSGED